MYCSHNNYLDCTHTHTLLFWPIHVVKLHACTQYPKWLESPLLDKPVVLCQCAAIVSMHTVIPHSGETSFQYEEPNTRHNPIMEVTCSDRTCTGESKQLP